MINHSMYKEYKIILNKINTDNSDYIEWGHALSYDIFFLDNIDILRIIKKLVKVFFINTHKFQIIEKGYKKNFLFIEHIHRVDYMDIFTKVSSIIDDSVFYRMLPKKSIRISNMKVYVNFIRILKDLELNNISIKIYLALLICENMEFCEKVNNILDKYNFDKGIVFCDAHTKDNIVSQVLKHRKIPTITLQHGQYIYQKENPNIHCLTYENFISDYMLVWGQATIDELCKFGIDKRRMILSGCPKFINYENINISVTNSNVFGVLLDNQVYIDSNKELIKLANKISNSLGKRYVLKLHPSNNLKDYIGLINDNYTSHILNKDMSIHDYAKMVEFSILHTSSTFVELNCMSSPVFRYKDEDYISMYDCDKDEFNSLDEFMDKYSLLKENCESWKSYMKQIEEYFVCGVEGTTERYKKILYSLNKLK